MLPVPLMNIINGGAHADNSLDFQEFMIVPKGAANFSEALRAGAEVFHTLKKLLHDRKASTGVGDEGGFAPDLPGAEAALGVVIEAIEKAGYKPGKDVALALDVASSELWDKTSKTYKLEGEGKELDGKGMVAFYRKLVRAVPDRVDRGRHGRERLGRLGGADRRSSAAACSWSATTCSSPTPSASSRGIAKSAANSVLVKVNQIGTLTETLEAVEMAHRNGWTTIISHRSGETEDTFIADLAVAMPLGPDQDRLARPLRARREVQPPAAHRTGAGRHRHLGRHARPAVAFGSVRFGCAPR